MSGLHGQVCFLNWSEVRRLVSNGADVNVQDGSGYTPLMHAVKRSEKMAEYLLQNGAGKSINATDKNGLTAWDHAGNNGRSPEAQDLVEEYGGESGKAQSTQESSDYGPSGYENYRRY
jgi:ankyrin repeat protein